MNEWTEAELDEALAELHRQPDAGGRALGNARARLMSAAHAKPRGFRWTWAASAAAVVALVAGGVTAANSLTGGDPSSDGSVILQRAAGAIATEKDIAVGPGQYRYVTEHVSALAQQQDGNGPRLAWRFGYLTRSWVPYDETQDWVQDNHATDEQKWVLGPPTQDHQKFGPPDGRISAPCGDFEAVFLHQRPSCQGHGDWKEPTSAWLATLPREPRQLLALLGSGSQAIQRSAGLLSSGLAPADLRAAIYHALALLPDLRVTEQSADLDGRPGVALGLTDDNMRQELIVDPATGAFLGQRSTLIAGENGLAAGTVMVSTSVTVTVVTSITP